MFKHRRHRRNRYKRNTIIVISVSVLVLFISVGYAAFSTNIDLHIKGNIVKYTVTLDPNGGNLDNTSKVVTYHDTYGQLPTPTREGYTFKGWHGKNLFNEEEILLAINNSTHENGYYSFTSANAFMAYNDGIPQINELKDNYQYTLTIKGHSLSDNGNFRIVFKYTDLSSSYTISLNTTEDTIISYSSKLGKTIDSLYMTYGYGKNIFVSYIQLEEGDTATEYEPYYVTSDTTVVQKKDHTLTAIWEENTP